MSRRSAPRLLLALAAVLAVASIAEAKKPKKDKNAEPAATPAAESAVSPAVATAIQAAMKPSVDACTDFYTYACGGWFQSTPLPPDKAQIVRGFTTIDDQNDLLLRQILDETAKNPGTDPEKVKLGQYWSSCMDEAAIDAQGARPIAPLWAKVDGMKDKKQLVVVAGELGAMGIDPFFDGFIGAANDNPELNIFHLYQGGISLPERTYYLDQSAEGQQLLQDYEKHIATMLMLGGLTADQAAKQSQKVLAFEKKMAEISWPTEKLYDVEATNNKLDLAGLQKLTPGFDWKAYLAASGVAGRTQINVATPSFFEAFDKLVKATPLEDLQAVYRWNIVHTAAPQLSREIVEADFAFFGTRLSGAQKLQDRWKRCVAATDGALGEVLGKAYIERAFEGNSKTIALELIAEVEKAFKANLPALEWMDDATRAVAVEKADAITNKIGYPDKWKDYSALTVEPGAYFANHLAAQKFNVQYQLNQWEKPVDKTEWGMTPPTVNAYYNPSANEIAVPAGILQPPFFDKDYPMAMNFGAIGMVMGHEVTHGFDDDGRKYDKTGRLTEWWAPDVSAKFEERTKCVVEQYGKFEAQPGLFVNGELTLGENIADLGGLKASYAAFKAWEARNGKQPTVAGLTPDQQFYVSYAQSWCSISKPELEKSRLLSDPHSPPRYRVNAPLTSLPEFAKAFNCAEGTPMNPPNKCEVW